MRAAVAKLGRSAGGVSVQVESGADERWDAVIAGGGVGGIALGTRLARRGYRVVMVEKRPPPEFRLGESLDWEAPVYLRRLGLPVDDWPAQGKATVKGGAICTSSAQPGVEAELGFHPVFRALMTAVGRAKPTIHANRELIDIDLMEAAHQGRRHADPRQGARGSSARASASRACGSTTAAASRAASTWTPPARSPCSAAPSASPTSRSARARWWCARASRTRYDGMGTRIRTDDTLGNLGVDVGHQRVGRRHRHRHRGRGRRLREAAPAVQVAGGAVPAPGAKARRPRLARADGDARDADVDLRVPVRHGPTAAAARTGSRRARRLRGGGRHPVVGLHHGAAHRLPGLGHRRQSARRGRERALAEVAPDLPRQGHARTCARSTA